MSVSKSDVFLPLTGPQTFIGDLHGWKDRLDALLPHITTPMVFLGDLIDRGPDSKGVVTTVMELCKSGKAQCIAGNHEFALVKALGHPSQGMHLNQDFFECWWQVYGGNATAHSYGVMQPNAKKLREAMGPHLDWIAGLPLFLQGSDGEASWLAVHSILDERPLEEQLQELSRPWGKLPERPDPLYARGSFLIRPCDLDPKCCLVSGHTPTQEALIKPTRISCDTTGGREHRRLVAVEWPALRCIDPAVVAVKKELGKKKS